MKKCFFIENEGGNDNNYLKALKFAIRLKNNDKEVGRIVILLNTKNQYSLLNSLSPNRRNDNSGKVSIGGVNIPVFTLRTYYPYTVSIDGKDILVTIGLDPEQFSKFEDKSEIKYFVHIPWSMEYSIEWIKSHNAVNILTGESVVSNIEIDKWVKGAIDWLKITSYPNSGFHHPSDSDRLKVASNALAQMKALINRETIIAYCLKISLTMEASEKIYEHFNKAQTHKFTASKDYPLSFLKERWSMDRD